VNDNNPSISCTPKLKLGSTETSLSAITYLNTKTASVNSITPRYGNVKGNEQIIIAGSNFVSGSTSVTIDGIPCAIDNVAANQIVCTTGSRPGDQPNPTFVVRVEGNGLASNKGNTFRYVSYWSDSETWGGDAPPQFGEAIQIPKGRSLLVNVDSVPQLSFIVVEGALIFAPHPTDVNHQRTFDAGYIFINGGYMEVGTEEFPYTSKMTITMHGDVTTPAIPTYGNKNIAVRRGQLHLVGRTRAVTWTMLDSTAAAGVD
jgi:G8 domain/IPT/TIG domain